MIKPLPEHEHATQHFKVTDIENRKNGQVLSMVTCWRKDPETISHKIHDTWDEYWSWLYAKAKKDKQWRTIYAHNGGGWDWLSLIHYLLNDGKKRKKSITAICAGSKMIMMRVTIEKRLSITFCDSLQLLRSSLDKLAKTYGLQGKIDFPYDNHETLFKKDRKLFNKYMVNDGELLLLVLENSLDLIRKRIAKIDGFSYTIGSTAMKVFKTVSMDRNISIPWEPGVKQLLREGYKGGRVEVFRCGVFDNVSVYDINSLYPHVMANTAVPCSDIGYFTQELEAGKVGCYRISFCQQRHDIPAVLSIGGESSYEGCGTFFTPEIELLMEVDKEAEIVVDTGFVFVDTDLLFCDYVNRLYNLRKSDPNGPVSLLCKFLLNSLYGKFGQKQEREKLVNVEPEPGESMIECLARFCETDTDVRLIAENHNIYGLMSKADCAFEHVGIAGMITSAARVELYKGMLHAGNDLIYVDTDSVHTTGKFADHLVSSSLGAWKLEDSGRGAYAGKKLYAILSSEGKEKIRAKGVSVGGRNGSRLGFNDMCQIVEGKKIECVYHKPPTPMQVFRGADPCVFSPKTRTLKRTSK